MSGSGSSNNTNNTGSADLEFIIEVDQSHALRYWVPTASKLSRGKKGIIQRMFTGEPMNNLCNVYIYNETSKLWYHEHTIQGDPSRGGNTTYPPSGSVLTSSSQTLSDGITYTTSASIDSGNAFKGFTGGDSWTTYDSSGSTNYYPHNAPSGYVGTWVAGTYVGSSSLGGVSGEWIKMELSTPFQPNEFTMSPGGLEFMQPDTWSILGSNDNSNWTNLGNFTNTGGSFGYPITRTLTISNTYTYIAIVFTKRVTNYWNTGDSEYIEMQNFSLTNIQPSEDFGRSLDGTDNADMVAVGAPGTWFGSVSNISGYARVFTKNSSGNGWTQRGSEVSQQGGFGHSVALSQYDGNILVVGAPFYNTLAPNASGNINFYSTPVSEGKVYIYKWDGANYTLQQTLNSPSGTLSTSTPATWKNFYFGYSLGITDIGDKIIVGEPSIRNIWYEPDQLQGKVDLHFTAVQTVNSFPYTGNAHVYDNVTVLSGGTTWTSNVSMTSVIGTTGIGTTDDTNPLKVRWLDALGTSVDINRAGTRILAGGPGSYGTSNTSPHAMSGRIYTLNWDPINAVWEEMGEVAKHIVAPQGNMLLGKTARFDGSGRRIVSGATGYIDHIEYYKGNVIIFDFNGDQWVSFPNEMVELAGSFFYWTNYQHKLGESISIDGEGEMVAIGKNENHYDLYNPTASPAAQVSGGFTVDNITYIGGATTSVAGSNSQISTGASTIWVYNISQSMVIKGNVTVGGYIQGTGISIGTNDDSSTSSKSIYFGGSKSDNAYELTVIENRVYEAEEKAELLIFKGNDNADASGGGTYGPDRIRLKGGQIVFDLNAGYDRTAEDIRAVMHRNAGGAGMLGINVTSPTEVIHVDGKIKATQGFIGGGTELTGLNFNYINNVNDLKFGQAGTTQSSTTWGEITLGSSIVYPTLALNSNSVSGYTVTASTDSVNAWKAFDDNTSYPTHSSDAWEIGADATYTNSTYIGSTERVSGYKGEWIEIQLPNSIYVERLDIYCTREEYQPRRLHMFGSNDGVTYDLIQYSGDKGDRWAGDYTYGTVFTRTPDIINESSYNRLLMIVNGLAGGSNAQYWKNINIYGKIGTFTPNVKLDYTGKIGILNANPSYPLDVTGDINLTGDLRIGGVAQSFGGGGGSPVWSLNGTNAYYNSGNVGIGTSTPASTLDVNGTVNLTSLLIPTYIIHKNDTNTYFGFPSDDTFIINTNGTERLRANSSGNVGIGTTSPGYKLDVDGDINMSSGSSLRINGVAQSFGGGGSPVWSLNSTNAYYNSGNVGIGTSSPGYKLDVDGDINMSSGSNLRINGVAQSFGGGGGGVTAGTASVSTSSNEITVSVSGGPYDYMYNETSYDVYSTSSTFNTINISTAMTHGQKLVLKLHTSAISIQGQFARGSSLSVIINGTTHTVFSNFQDHNLHIPYDNNATAVSFLILEITKENSNQVTIEAKLSAADFTKTREFNASFNYNGIYTFNRDSAIHNVAYNSYVGFSGSTFQLRLGYLGVGHSHDFYFTQNDPTSPTFQASQIEFYYNNSLSSWSQASQTNVYTNFDKSVGMTLTYNKEYRMHHEVIQASTDDYPSKILFTVEELNAASGGGGGGGSYGTGDFSSSVTIGGYIIEINSSFSSATNYNYNSSYITYNDYNIDYINLSHTLPSSLPLEYHVYFRSNNSFSIYPNFKVQINGLQKTTYNNFGSPYNNNSFNIQSSSSYRYEVILKSRDTSHSEWTAEWREYRS